MVRKTAFVRDMGEDKPKSSIRSTMKSMRKKIVH